MAYKALIIDFGRVIAFFDYEKVFREWAKESKLQISSEDMKADFAASGLLSEFESGKIQSTQFIQIIKKRYGLADTSDEKIISIWQDIFTPNNEMIKVIKGFDSGLRLILGSTTNPLHFEHYRQEFHEVLNRFSNFILSFEVGYVKPETAFYRACLKAAQAEPEECFYIDDIAEYIAAAKKIGIEGLVYSPQVNIENELRMRGIGS